MAEDQTRTLQDKFMLRLPDGMRDTLKHFAAENKRSLNAEIIARLQSSLDLEGMNTRRVADDRIQEIVERAVRRVLGERDDGHNEGGLL